MNKKLSGFLEQARTRSFDWTSANCAHFSGSWVELAEGHNPLNGAADNVESKSAADERIARLGGLINAITSAMNRNSIPPSTAQSGDIVCIKIGKANAIGVCDGRMAAFVAPEGLTFVGMEFVIAAWPVGRQA